MTAEELLQKLEERAAVAQIAVEAVREALQQPQEIAPGKAPAAAALSPAPRQPKALPAASRESRPPGKHSRQRLDYAALEERAVAILRERGPLSGIVLAELLGICYGGSFEILVRRVTRFRRGPGSSKAPFELVNPSAAS